MSWRPPNIRVGLERPVAEGYAAGWTGGRDKRHHRRRTTDAVPIYLSIGQYSDDGTGWFWGCARRNATRNQPGNTPFLLERQRRKLLRAGADGIGGAVAVHTAMQNCKAMPKRRLRMGSDHRTGTAGPPCPFLVPVCGMRYQSQVPFLLGNFPRSEWVVRRKRAGTLMLDLIAQRENDHVRASMLHACVQVTDDVACSIHLRCLQPDATGSTYADVGW